MSRGFESMRQSLPAFRIFHRKTSLYSTITPVSTNKSDESFMRMALRHAQHAYREKEVPVGAVIVDKDGKVIATSRNRVEAEHDATAHAELNCMRRAAKLMGNWRLSECTLYTTLEPCAMCMGAMQSFRLKKVVYGAKDLRLGACGSWTNLNLPALQHPFHNIEIEGGVLANESSTLLKSFFQSVRREKNGNLIESADYTGNDIPEENYFGR